MSLVNLLLHNLFMIFFWCAKLLFMEGKEKNNRHCYLSKSKCRDMVELAWMLNFIHQLSAAINFPRADVNKIVTSSMSS